MDELKDSTILIVDDQPKNLDVLISSLERYDFDFMVAQNGKLAIERAIQSSPDMILLDILMPGMDGFEVCKKLRSMPQFVNTPIIFMSALTETVDKIKGFELGAVDYITKPFQLEEIIARIRTHLTISKLRKSLHNANLHLEEKVEQRTQELQAQMQLSMKLENKYQRLIEALQEGIWATNIEGETDYVNPRMADILGYPAEALLTKSILDFIPDCQKPRAKTMLEAVSNENSSGDLQLFRNDNSIVDISMSCSSMYGSNGKSQGVLIAVVDISKRKKAERELLYKEEKLQKQNRSLSLAKVKAEESDRLKTAFLANLSHEIRTPMNAVVGFAELLKMNDSEARANDFYLDKIVTGTHQLKNIITDIIDISKIQSRQYPIYKDKFDLLSFMEGVVFFVEQELDVHNKTDVVVRKKISFGNEKITVESDQQRLMDIFTKLVQNAVKFTPKGEIIIGCEIQNDQILFSVNDTGIGIGKNAQQFIFEQFRQVEETYTRQFGGTGLGLTIAKGLVELLGGKIHVESEKNVGSSFLFSIPITPTSGLPEQQDDVQTKVVVEEKDFLQDTTILIAEDEEINVLYLCEVFRETAVTVIVARDGREAIDLFHKHPEINLILMDIKMPYINGYEAFREIRKTSSVPIVAQTAYAMSDDEDRVIREGFSAYLTKPLKPKHLMEVVAKLLSE